MCDAPQTVSHLRNLVPEQTPVLCTSEVALVYMPSDASDALLDSIAATFPSSTYAFLEQLVPFDEGDVAFASTMLHHFQRRVHTPLRGTVAYPTLEAHRARLAKLWQAVSVETMLEAWQGFSDRNPSEARRLVSVEPFDEWQVSRLLVTRFIR